MARVNRTTGFFLVLGIAILLSTVVAARWLTPEDKPAEPDPQPADTGVFCSGNVDNGTGLSVLVSSIAGKVKEIRVKEGDSVKKDQVLVVLDDQTAREELDIRKKELDVAKAKLVAAKKIAAEKKTEHELKVIELQRNLNQAEAALKLAEENRATAENQVRTGLDSTAMNRLKAAQIAVEAAKKDKSAAEEALAKLKSIDPSVPLTEHEEALKASELRLKAAKSQLEAFVIKAPADGEIFRINYQVGGPCPLPIGDANASNALVFCPNEAMIVRAEVDQEQALMVKAGMEATLTFRASDRNYTWKGKVEKVSNYIERRRSRTMEPDQFNDSKTRECIIRIEPNAEQPVLHGMRMSVQIKTGKAG